MSGVSDEALENARQAMIVDSDLRLWPSQWKALLGDAGGPAGGRLAAVVEAAHDPQLGPKRSVCLETVLEIVRGESLRAADLLERELGGGAGQ